MTNPMRGEAEIGPRKLIVNFNGWCTAEAATGLKTQEILRLLAEERLSFIELRALLRSFMDKEMSSEEVGGLIDEVGLEPSLKALSTAMEGFFPAPEKKPRPPKAA